MNNENFYLNWQQQQLVHDELEFQLEQHDNFEDARDAAYSALDGKFEDFGSDETDFEWAKDDREMKQVCNYVFEMEEEEFNEFHAEALYTVGDFESLIKHLDLGELVDYEHTYTVSYAGKSVEVIVNEFEWMALDTMTASMTPDWDGMHWEAAQLGAAELGVGDVEDVEVTD